MNIMNKSKKIEQIEYPEERRIEQLAQWVTVYIGIIGIIHLSHRCDSSIHEIM